VNVLQQVGLITHLGRLLRQDGVGLDELRGALLHTLLQFLVGPPQGCGCPAFRLGKAHLRRHIAPVDVDAAGLGDRHAVELENLSLKGQLDAPLPALGKDLLHQLPPAVGQRFALAQASGLQ
jgi:hypothetical protein